MRIALLWTCLVTISFSTYGQHVHEYKATVGGFFSSGPTPFWLRSNQYGVVPIQNPTGSFAVGLRSDYRTADSTRSKPLVDWGYGIDAVANAGQANQLLLPEAYVKGRLGAFELYAGRRREIVGLVDTLLTSGAYIWSGNALPIPKIQIGLPQFTPIPFTKGIVSIMGVIAHGWFENSDRLVKGSYLHQKYFYGRFGKPTWPFRLYAGFNHQVIWAGYSDYLIGSSAAVNGRLPSSIKYFPAVFWGSRNTQANGIDVTSFEDNRVGNHLGSIDFAVDVNLGQWNAMLYRQFFYDDGSLFYLLNVQDGLNGVRFKRKKQSNGLFSLRQVTFEYMFSGSQGGDLFILEDPKRRGRDDYFNHSQFLDGWTYYKRTIGTPFFTTDTEVSNELPARGGAGIANNRVSLFHVGLSAIVANRIDLTGRLSYSINAGTYATPYGTLPRQFSGIITAGIPTSLFGDTQLTASLAVDAGKLLPNSVGGYIGLRKKGLLNSRPAQRIVSPR
ncbi:capsule assembly Wzi family protein [Spirosoma sp. KUDC1026]|uniref:capsule assembly Wzi family protein n=1 Tax=Spirosoma sp. KUDC1026 TaxID=2745947 RepID=UPI00159BCF49|nr:capsule assembly Wzi family protein [Spirosoma sp. KUDC1026]QKZ11946.1 hypothetical protein HU175_04590 [Spirosoma sp. KUDC1026]